MNIFINKLLLLSFCGALSGCLSDYLPPNPKQEQEALLLEAVAAGSGCRQVGRSLESCYERNERLPKSGILNGWRDMDDYMRTNKMQSQEISEPVVYGTKAEIKNPDGSIVLQQSDKPVGNNPLPVEGGKNFDAPSNVTSVVNVPSGKPSGNSEPTVPTLNGKSESKK